MKSILYFLFVITGLNLAAQTAEYKKLTDEGLELLEQNMPDDAMKKYNKALLLDSNRVEAYYGLGVANYLLCRKAKQTCSEAIKYFDKAMSVNPNYRQSYYNRGSCKALTNDFNGALEDFNRAIELDSKNGYYYYNRAFIKLTLGDKNGACTDVKYSSKLGYQAADSKINQICN
jgi:tetratricopeptide (TPR) repeat protein